MINRDKRLKGNTNSQEQEIKRKPRLIGIEDLKETLINRNKRLKGNTE